MSLGDSSRNSLGIDLLDIFRIVLKPDSLGHDLPHKRLLGHRQGLLFYLVTPLQTLYSSLQKCEVVHNFGLIEIKLRF